jgi:hypothetical protein
MQMKTRARVSAVIGIITAGVGMASAIYFGQRWSIAFNAFMLTCTVVVGIYAFRITYR